MSVILLSTFDQHTTPTMSHQEESSQQQPIDHLKLKFKFSLSFFLFGLLNNVLYVIIISAALDLVPSSIPTGVILAVDITPSLIVKIGLPYLVKGPVNYPPRILICSALSFFGMMIIVFSNLISLRLIGISLASISSGLGEMTFLQLTTRYDGSSGVSWFSSGTGAAGLLGAGLWWFLRSLGIRIGLGISSILPLCISLIYFLILPKPEDIKINKRGDYSLVLEETEQESEIIHEDKNNLSLNEKIKLTKPLLIPYMIPLFTVYFAEYTINTGIAPTLLYPLPQPKNHSIFSLIFKSLKDYYPFWQLTYQTFVFFSRSSIAIFKFPPLPKRLIYLPSLIQMILFLIILMESSLNLILNLVSINWIYFVLFVLISFEGILGGLAYISTYYWLGDSIEIKLKPIEIEFRLACVGFSDTLGILFSSIFSSWLQIKLCSIQISNGKLLCKEKVINL